MIISCRLDPKITNHMFVKIYKKYFNSFRRKNRLSSLRPHILLDSFSWPFNEHSLGNITMEFSSECFIYSKHGCVFVREA